MSGSISPFDRKDLGPWLTDPEKISLWDAIIVAKLDRLTRNLFDFLEFWRWCDAHGKAIISVQERHAGVRDSATTRRCQQVRKASFRDRSG